MFDLKVCTVCLQMDVKCYNLNTNSQLKKDYNLISGLQNCNRNGLPQYLCYLCTAYVKSSKRFRDRCQRAYCVLTEILQRNKQITKPIIQEIDCDALKIGPTLSFLNDKRVKTNTDSVKKWMQECRNSIEQHKSTASEQYGRLVDKLVFENNPSITIKDEITISNNNVDLTKEERHNDTENTNAVDLLGQDFDAMDQDFDIDDDVDEQKEPIVSTNLDEVLLNLDFAEMVPLSVAEAKAVLELNELIMINQGRHKCDVCKRSFQSEKRLEAHKRMHDKHVSGTWLCELCNYYYKSEFLLRTHITDKHMYKYLCKMCPEVSFDRLIAKRHYMWTHLHKKPLRKAKSSNLVTSKLASKGPAKGTQTGAKWLDSKGMKKDIQPVKKKSRKHPDDYLIYSPISQEEQYAIVRDSFGDVNMVEYG